MTKVEDRILPEIRTLFLPSPLGAQCNNQCLIWQFFFTLMKTILVSILGAHGPQAQAPIKCVNLNGIPVNIFLAPLSFAAQNSNASLNDQTWFHTQSLSESQFLNYKDG